MKKFFIIFVSAFIIVMCYVLTSYHTVNFVESIHYKVQKLCETSHPDTLFLSLSDISETTKNITSEKSDSIIEWVYTWSATPADSSIRASICKMKYGKKWAYCVELDDGDCQTGLFAPDFFAQFRYTDAPPGVHGGKSMPVVGDLAINLFPLGVNRKTLNSNDLSLIQEKGWGISNHSYYHAGHSWGESPEILSKEQIRNDLFWSQTILAKQYLNGVAPTHFVYPNGYTDYANYFCEFGITSGSLFSGTGGRNLYQKDQSNLLYLTRSYLDEKVWSKNNNSLLDIPDDGFEEGDLQIDFTHAINNSSYSNNQKRWKERLSFLEQHYGAKGSDEFWSAPPGTVINYTRAVQAAKVEVTAGVLKVGFPYHLSGTPLTIKLEHVPENTDMPTPDGGILYRQAGTVWITTPTIGAPGNSAPKPVVKEIYRGVIVPYVKLSAPAKIAAIQIKTHGKPVDLAVYIKLPNDTIELWGNIKASSDYTMGYHLLASVPNGDAITAKGLQIKVEPNHCFHEIVIWALDE